MIGLRRRGFSTTRSPSNAVIGLGSPAITVNGTTGGGVDPQILFRADFSNPNANGSNIYNFQTRSGTTNTGEQQDGQPNGSYEHLPTGGPTGGPCVRFSQFAGRYQYALTYTTPGFNVAWNASAPGRNAIFYRWIIKTEDGSRWDANTCGGKFIDHGNTSAANRNIVWFLRMMSLFNSADAYGRSTYQLEPKTFPSYFGLSGSNEFGWQNSPHTNMYGCQYITRGVGYKGCLPGIVTSPDHFGVANPNVGPNSAPTSTGGWIYGQAMAQLGSAPYQYAAPPTVPAANSTPHSRYAVWLQNNTFASPTGAQENWDTATEAQIMDGSSWNQGVVVGTYCGGGSGSFSSQVFRWRLAAFEVGTAFDPTWFPG